MTRFFLFFLHEPINYVLLTDIVWVKVSENIDETTVSPVFPVIPSLRLWALKSAVIWFERKKSTAREINNQEQSGV